MSKHLLFALLLVAGMTIAGGIYKWVDDSGRVVYSDNPPVGKSAKAVDLPRQPPQEVLEKAQDNLRRLQQERLRREQAREVLGTIALGFAPTKGAMVPTPPFAITLVIKPADEGSELRLKITDPSPEWKVENQGVGMIAESFAISLKPGSYEITRIEVGALSLSRSPVVLATPVTRFIVPDADCVYVGRVGYVFLRLPPGSLDEARILAGAMAKERGVAVVVQYYPEGPLILSTTSLDIPTTTERMPGPGGSRRAYERALEKNCAIQLARF